MTKERVIKSPEYTDSNERRSILYGLIIDGQDADAVIKYADKFLEEYENLILAYAKEGKQELLKEAALEYKVASKFMEMLKHASIVGKQKAEAYEKLRGR